MLLVAELVIVAALERRESRGSHWRLDYPSAAQSLERQHYVFQRASIDHYEYRHAREEMVSHAASAN
jgi:aspartate oxidase